MATEYRLHIRQRYMWRRESLDQRPQAAGQDEIANGHRTQIPPGIKRKCKRSRYTSAKNLKIAKKVINRTARVDPGINAAMITNNYLSRLLLNTHEPCSRKNACALRRPQWHIFIGVSGASGIASYKAVTVISGEVWSINGNKIRMKIFYPSGILPKGPQIAWSDSKISNDGITKSLIKGIDR